MNRNKRNRFAFTLIELLLALSVSGFIIIGMIQGFRNVQDILSKSRTLLHINKSVCLLFNQIERDFNTAFIPTVAKIEKKDRKSKKESKKEKEKTAFFIAESSEADDKVKIRDKKYDLFKNVSFVNTNPLQIWGQKKSRLVRVRYELVKNKSRSTRDKTSYDLYRKETSDLENEKFKEKKVQIFTKKKQPVISKQIVATNIKGMFVEYVMPKPKKKDDLLLISEKEKEQLLELFSWGKTKETKNVVPQKAEIYIMFWDEMMQGQKMFSCTVPIFSYPTEKVKKPVKKNDKKKNDKQKEQKPPAKKNPRGSRG